MSVSSRHSARFRLVALFLFLALPSLWFGLLTSVTSKSAGPVHHQSQIQSELLPATIQSSESQPQVIPGPEGSFFRVDGRALVQVLPNGGRSVWHEFSETEAVNAQLLEIGGTLFGTTQTGGAQNLGTLFGFNPQTGEVMTIWNFGGLDGARPAGNLIADRQGNIYGTTLNGGEDDNGVVFRIKLDGTGYKPVFHYLKSDGYDPTAGLILLADGSVTPVINPTEPENQPVESQRGEFQPAATFTVTTAAELVTAINTANTNSQADIINLTANIGLTSALPTLASNGGNSTTINGGGFTVFRAGGSFRIFTISNGAVVIMNNMTISGGSTGAFGGGILNQGNLTISNCRISGNSGARGGGIRNENLLTMTDCTVSGNTSGEGGGAGFEFGTSTISGCTFTGNIQTDGGAGSGGGVSHTLGGNVFLTNCTITGNTAASFSGAAGVSIILGSGSTNLANCTITSNTTSGPGGGIRNFNGALNLRNTIIFGNTSNEIDGGVSFNANNLVGSNGTGGISNGVNGNIVGSNPVLGPLASNGGPTQTQAIGCASPARDAGTTVGTPTTDQRGVTRDTAPDIGAFEGPLVVSIGSPTPPSFDSPGSVSFPVTYVGAASVNLTNAAITVNTTGSVVGTANVTNGTTATPTVTVTVTSGVGTVGISIAAGTATGNCGSGPTSATTAGPSLTATVTTSANGIAEAGNNQTVCASSPAVTLNGSFSGGATSATWSGGAGSFNPNTSALNAVYTPSAGEIAAGTVTLTLTTNDPPGSGVAGSDTVVITINPIATVEAGNNQTVCATTPAVTLNGSVGGGASSGTWSGGAGSFAPNASTLNAVYTPSAGEISAGTVTLTLTTN
ncbi:MAG TPA: choice-of-anchor Q domain-containing protein, partial [Acidobacteriota bacterium]|nr:choice-of-anchor Q domain-containing protein [Acidobacteriota bacterium]